MPKVLLNCDFINEDTPGVCVAILAFFTRKGTDDVITLISGLSRLPKPGKFSEISSKKHTKKRKLTL